VEPAVDRQQLSYDVCLEVRGEFIRTVLFCTVHWSCAQSWAVFTVLWVGFCHTRPISLCIDLWLSVCIWGGPDGIEAYSFILLVGSFDRKNPSPIW